MAARRVRRVLDFAHRWLGLVCGLLIAVAGLTGSILAFYMEIDAGVNPNLRTDHPRAVPASYEALYEALRVLPEHTQGYWSMEIPKDGGPVTSRFFASDFRAYNGGSARIRLVTVDPVTGKVLRDALWGDTFFTWIYDLHWKILAGNTGKVIMGIVAIGGLIVLITGTTIWLMPRSSWASKLHFKRPAGVVRRTYDLHKLIGLYGLPLMLLCIGTAAMLNLSNQVRPMINAVSPLRPGLSAESTPVEGARRIPLDQAITTGRALFEGARVVWVRVPALATDAYEVQIWRPGEPVTRFPKTRVRIDQYSGQVLEVRDPRTNRAGDVVLDWLVPLHDGKAMGTIGRVIVMILGLVPAALFVTGFMRWRQKAAARKKRLPA